MPVKIHICGPEKFSLLNNLTFKHSQTATIFPRQKTFLKQRPGIKFQNLFWAPWKNFAGFVILMVTDFILLSVDCIHGSPVKGPCHEAQGCVVMSKPLKRYLLEFNHLTHH